MNCQNKQNNEDPDQTARSSLICVYTVCSGTSATIFIMIMVEIGVVIDYRRDDMALVIALIFFLSQTNQIFMLLFKLPKFMLGHPGVPQHSYGIHKNAV